MYSMSSEKYLKGLSGLVIFVFIFVLLLRVS